MSLPSGYTRLEYIESTGTQYIDTGIYASDDLMIKLQITPNPNYLSEYSILGVEWSLNGFFLMFYQNAIRFHSKGTSVDVTSFNKSSKNEIVCKSNSLTVNGAVYMLSGGGTNSQTYQIRLFSVANEGSYPSSPNKRGHFKLWQTQVYNGSTLIRDFIPCKNASGEVGLWDDVNSQFYQNAGTGSFIAGEMPKGTHKTLINGTAYEVKGGKCLINGTVYSIKKGRTLINGTGYDITFAPAYDPVFANNTWEQIIEACHNNEVPDTWKVADHKPMTINGEDYQIDIIGKNHDDYSDGSGKAPLTFQMHDCYRNTMSMNSSSTNNGGWTSCAMRNTHLPKILSQMPMEVQSGIREVNKLTSAGNGSNTINTTADKLFLPSEIEIFGSVNNSYIGEGTQYDYYKAGNSKVKNYDGSVRDWWERSPRSNFSTGFCCVLQSGIAGNGFAAQWFGVAFGFCF